MSKYVAQSDRLIPSSIQNTVVFQMIFSSFHSYHWHRMEYHT